MEHTVDEIREIIGSDSEMAKKINSMPYNLQLEDLMGFFNFLRVNYSKINTPARLSVYEDWNFQRFLFRARCFWSGIIPIVFTESEAKRNLTNSNLGLFY